MKARLASGNRRNFPVCFHLAQIRELLRHLRFHLGHPLLELRQLPERLEDWLDAQEPPIETKARVEIPLEGIQRPLRVTCNDVRHDITEPWPETPTTGTAAAAA